MIIDSHVHIWDLDRAEYPWLGPGAAPLDRTITFDEITPTFHALGIGGAILVQASDEATDTQVMLDAAAANPKVLGVVAWSPLDDAATLEVDLDRFRDRPVVGIRNLVHEHPREWLDRAAIREGLAVLSRSGLPLDFPTATHHAIADVVILGAQNPGLRIVLDHLGKPPIGGSAEQRGEWRALISEAARNPHTVAKLSGLYATQGKLDAWTTKLVRPYVEDALEIFGSERLLYGGDWPISVLAGGYQRTWNAISDILVTLSGAERAAVMGGTAKQVYGLSASA